MRVEVGSIAAKADVSFREADHEIAVEGAQNLAAEMVSDDEGGVKLAVHLKIKKKFAGDMNEAVEFVEGVERADEDVAGHGK